MNALAKLRALETELSEMGIAVKLELTPAGIVVKGCGVERQADRLLAKKHLREKGMVICKPESQ